VDTSTTFRPRSESVLILVSDESDLIMPVLLLLSESAMSIGEIPGLVSHEEHGTRPVWGLSLRILQPNFGTAIWIMRYVLLTRTLLSMSLEVVSPYRTSSDGSTVIQFVLKRKEAQFVCLQAAFGSRPIWNQLPGIQNWIQKQPQLCCDD